MNTFKKVLSAALVVLVLMSMAVGASATNLSDVKPTDKATVTNVLAVLQKYDPEGYHILTKQRAVGDDFSNWFYGRSIISCIDTTVHETYHGYQFDQRSSFYGVMIYFDNSTYYNVDMSDVYRSGFTKTEQMSKNIPTSLRTFRYDDYVAVGSYLDANTKSVYGLLEEFTAYYRGLRTMNNLVQFLIDSDAGAEAWAEYALSVGNNMTAYSEFKYWTLRYMNYIKSANPTLYKKILDNQSYWQAYKTAETKFAGEIERAKKLIAQTAPLLSQKGLRIAISDSSIYLYQGYSGYGVGMTDYTKLMTELKKPEYTQMDAILKHQSVKSYKVMRSPQKLLVDGEYIDCEKYNIDGSNYFKLRDIAAILDGYYSRFGVDWDESLKKVTITSGKHYSFLGTELIDDGKDKSSTAVPSSQSIVINDSAVSNLSVYNIGGNNYFKLRDLGQALGFGVDYDAATNTAIIIP